MAQATVVTDLGRKQEDPTEAAEESVPAISAKCAGECVGTFLLVLFGCGAVHSAVLTGALNGLWQVAIVWGVSIMVVFAVTDERNRAGPPKGLAAVFIGLTVSGLIAFIAPLTQACFNPARDFGPRLFAYFAGWGSIALPGPRGLGFFTVYILAPLVGAVIGAGLYCRLLSHPTPNTAGR